MGFQQLVYDSDQVRINIGGFQASRGSGASGYAADGPFIEIEQDGPSFTVRRGTDGTETRSKTNDHGASAKLHTSSSNSPTNDFLSGLIAADEAAPNGASIVSLTIEDMQGTTLFIADSAYLLSRPKWDGAAEAVDLEWPFHAIWRVFNVGGN